MINKELNSYTDFLVKCKAIDDVSTLQIYLLLQYFLIGKSKIAKILSTSLM